MKKHFLVLLPLTAILLFTACQKEVSTELTGTVSAGSLQAGVTGECLPKTIQGIYEVGEVLNADSNYIDVQVEVTGTGTYRVYTDTINGVFFESKGTFASAGLSTVRLKGVGTPLAAGIHNFTIQYGSTECTVAVSTLAQGGAGGGEFTFVGAPDACMNFQPTGDYIAGVDMTPANTVVINVNVTVLGTYTLTTKISNGISFSGSGSFTNMGLQTITLTADGRPVVAGNTNFPVELLATSSSCYFSVDVTAMASSDYFPRNAGSNWSYQFDPDPNDSLFIRAKAGSVTLAGNAYTAFEATNNAALGFADYGAYRKVGSSYHTYLDLADYFAIDETTAPIDYIFLRDDVPAATTWRSDSVKVTFAGVSVNMRIVLTVEQKDVSVTVGGTAYPNTIVVTEKYEGSAIPNVWFELTEDAGYFRSSYSRNTGLIKQDYHEPDGTFNPPVSYQQNIRR